MNPEPSPPATYSAAFERIETLATLLRIPDLRAHPRVWEHDLDDGWAFAVNGTDATATVRGWDVPPFHAGIYMRGWLFGLIHPTQGGMIGGPIRGGEDEFLAALDRAIAAAPGRPQTGGPS